MQKTLFGPTKEEEKSPAPHNNFFEPPKDKVFRWDTTPCDIATAWQNAYNGFDLFAEPKRNRIKEIKDEIYEIKGNRMAWASAKKRSLRREMENLLKEINRYDAEMESWWIEEQIALREETVELARRMGVYITEENESLFADDFLLTILERPGIEWSWNLLLATVHMKLVREWQEEKA